MRTGLKKENPFTIETVERSVSSTSFELLVEDKDFWQVTMQDLLLFMQSQLHAI